MPMSDRSLNMGRKGKGNHSGQNEGVPRHTRKKSRDRENEPLFSHWTPWLVTAVTSALRVYYVTEPRNWWVLHPDEIFQSMEVAHSELYGYGLRPYEFIAPFKGDNLSHYMMKEKELGMNAMRSPLFPQFFMLVSLVTSWFSLHSNPYLLWRISHALVSSWLPLALAQYIRTAFGCSDVAAMASILTALSAYMNVVGTHTLVNSFVSPFLFLALAHSIKLISAKPEQGSSPGPRQGGPRPTCTFDSKTRTAERNTVIKSHCSSFGDMFWKAFGFPYFPLASLRVFLTNETPDKKYGSPTCSVLEPDTDSYRAALEVDSSRNGCSRSYFGQEGFPTSDVYAEPIYHDGEASTPTRAIIKTTRNFISNFIFGLVMVLSVYIRPDSALLVGFLLASSHDFRATKVLLRRRSTLCYLLGAVIGLLVALGDDVYFYDYFVVSPWNWAKFNVFSNLSSRLFGTSGSSFYVDSIFLRDRGMIALSCVFLVAMVIALARAISEVWHRTKGNGKQDAQLECRGALRILQTYNFCRLRDHRIVKAEFHAILFVAFVMIYSCAKHKEQRFLHDTVSIFFTSVAGFLVPAAHCVFHSRLRKKSVLVSILLAFGASQWLQFNGEHATPTAKLRCNGADANRCLHFLSLKNDVAGLFLDRSLQDTGTFSILHKNVPLIFLFGVDYLEFDISSLISLNRACVLRDNCAAGFFSLNRVSDLIHSKNSQYLVKRLIESTYYNYAIVRSGQEFFKPGFVEVFKTMTLSVWRRRYDRTSEKNMQATAADIPPGGVNSTIMEYEAEILKQMGSYKVALGRFDAAIQRGVASASMYASMAFCLHRMEDRAGMESLLEVCFRQFSRQECLDGGNAKRLNFGGGFRADTSY